MYKTLQAQYYWPDMALDCHSNVRNCIECVRERVRTHESKGLMKLFTRVAPLEEVAMYLLGPLFKTARVHEFLLVITDRLSKVTRAIPLKISSAPAVS